MGKACLPFTELVLGGKHNTGNPANILMEEPRVPPQTLQPLASFESSNACQAPWIGHPSFDGTPSLCHKLDGDPFRLGF